MSLDSPAADLYTHFSLDSRDTCRELSILLEAKQAQLGSLGFLGESDELAQVRTAQQILSSPEKRATYDQGIDQGMQPTWSTLSFLAQHGEWPAANPQPQNTTYGSYAPTYAQAGAAPSSPYGDPLQQNHFTNQPVPQAGSAEAAAQRPTGGTRFLMAVVDFFLATAAASLLTAPLAVVFNSDVLVVVTGLVMALYALGFEVLAGGSPAKLAMGYRVRDIETKQKLSVAQSAKRQWWRLINVVPGIGQVVGLIAGMVYLGTITPAKGMRGTHDEIANAEVVKKPLQ
ncbi:RDD family protein [Corynebacterium flavescens]|uniref:RDD family protein n=1 Tax=Corynebacterium flavescens TaxID=28028 RepID=A0A1L7CK90_CORFL|nr:MULTISPECIES: RDD family protein [Corynebacterium]APT86229.1 hypothetical protein CFLV_02825 [Corynebacterium flavescens]MDN6099558.1 RDD family protein [Corynebacterium flavescens]MDN6430691.1 RDD family protein [Corynebacterium flavescens]MDN6474498.1 RDD family protein [Corynebacterium flavescens]MDN6530843.1 RDD family protein [Corynebacterium flavescens]